MIFRYEYLLKVEAIFEHSLACQSGAKMGKFNEKLGCNKSHDTVPLLFGRSSRDSGDSMPDINTQELQQVNRTQASRILAMSGICNGGALGSVSYCVLGTYDLCLI